MGSRSWEFGGPGQHLGLFVCLEPSLNVFFVILILIFFSFLLLCSICTILHITYINLCCLLRAGYSSRNYTNFSTQLLDSYLINLVFYSLIRDLHFYGSVKILGMAHFSSFGGFLMVCCCCTLLICMPTLLWCKAGLLAAKCLYIAK